MSGRGFIAVHVGAGYHSPANSELYKQVCRTACHQALEMLKQKRSALEAVTVAIRALEDSPWTNAGIGSNLTITGQVECDASIMDGESLHYGAVGAITGVRNPIRVAENLIKTQMLGPMSLGRIPPSTLVGPGAKEWAKKNHIPVSKQEDLLTDASKRAFIKHKRKLDMLEEGLPLESNKRIIKMDHSNTRGDGQQDTSHQTICTGNRSSCIIKHQKNESISSQPMQNIESNVTHSTDGQTDKCSSVTKLNEFNKETVISSIEQKVNDNDKMVGKYFNPNAVSSLEASANSKQLILKPISKKEINGQKKMNNDCAYSFEEVGDINQAEQNCIKNKISDSIGHKELNDCASSSVAKRCNCNKCVMTDVIREDNLLDTVGAVCVDENGQVASGVSSGGIVLKQPGRLGQAALYGCGCWAECNQKTNTGVGVSTSGCGEHLTKTLIARECADSMNRHENPAQGMAEAFQDKFLDSHFLQSLDQKLGGALGVKSEKAENKVSVEVLWAHTTDSMCLAYMSTQDKQPKVVIMMKKHNIISKTICYSLSVRSFSLSLVLVSNKNIKKKKTFATYMEYNAFQSQTLREFGPVRKVDKRSWKILMGQKEHSLNDSLNYYNEAEYYSIPRDKKFIPFPETKNIKKSIVLPVREVKPDIRLKETIDNNKKSAKTNYNESSVSNNTENSHKKLSIRQSLQTIGSYPLLGNPETKLPYMEYLQPMLTALPREPSVGNILRETMSEQSKAALDRWMKMKIKELGEEGFQQYKQDLFSTGSNFHSCVAAKLQNKPEIPLKPKTEPLWESVQSVFTDISEVEMVEATTTHKELGYMGILDGVIRYRDELVLVDWKTSDREKKTLDAAYDDPVQVLAYMGAVNSDSSCNLTVKDGLLVVAYRDGRPADVLKIPGVLCHMYWKKWLARLYKYWSFRLI